MALSRSMKNLMHDSAQARRGGGNPTGGGVFGKMRQAVQQSRGREQYNPGGNRGRMPGGNRGPVLRPSPGGTPPTGGRGGMASKIMAKYSQAQRGGGGGMARPAVQPPQRGPGTVAGKPRPGVGTFGFAAQRGAAPAMPGPAALAQPRGQTMAQRIGGRQGPPARAGGMARALGSGGSRRRLLR